MFIDIAKVKPYDIRRHTLLVYRHLLGHRHTYAVRRFHIRINHTLPLMKAGRITAVRIGVDCGCLIRLEFQGRCILIAAEQREHISLCQPELLPACRHRKTLAPDID